MSHLSCPSAAVNAPIERVWSLLTDPLQWDAFYDVRIMSVDPVGRAMVGQRVLAESGPRWLHLKLAFEFTHVDPVRHQLGFNVRLPFGVRVREDLDCVALGAEACHVNYRCDF